MSRLELLITNLIVLKCNLNDMKNVTYTEEQYSCYCMLNLHKPWQTSYNIVQVVHTIILRPCCLYCKDIDEVYTTF